MGNEGLDPVVKCIWSTVGRWAPIGSRGQIQTMKCWAKLCPAVNGIVRSGTVTKANVGHKPQRLLSEEAV